MEITFKTAKVIQDSGSWLCLKVNSRQAEEFVNNMKDTTYSANLKIHREKRSLDANAYLWALINEISNVIRSSKEEVYLEMLKRYGQTGAFRADISYIDMLMKSYKYIEVIYKDETYVDFQIWVGSSEYDTYQMSVLLDGVISECKDLGIETKPKEEIESLIAEWNK